MDPASIKLIAIAFIMAIGSIFPSIAIGKIGSKGAEAIGRNPEAGPRIQMAMILSIAFVEAIVIYSLVISLILKFVE